MNTYVICDAKLDNYDDEPGEPIAAVLAKSPKMALEKYLRTAEITRHDKYEVDGPCANQRDERHIGRACILVPAEYSLSGKERLDCENWKTYFVYKMDVIL